MKKALVLLLALAMVLSLAACGSAPAATPAEEPAAETVMFTDSCGREVELPANITKIAPSGTVATMILAAFAPEKLVCTGTKIGDNCVVAAGSVIKGEFPANTLIYQKRDTEVKTREVGV